MNPTSKIGARLKHIVTLLAQPECIQRYQYVWDCCCDHGYLGYQILQQDAYEKVIFVDQVDHIMTQLAEKLAQFSTAQHHLMTADAGTLKFELNKRHVVILAGIGGEQCIEIVTAMAHRNPNCPIDYIFCPSNRPYQLRAYLHQVGYGLRHEAIVTEKKRHYEVIQVQNQHGSDSLKPVSLIGEMWDLNQSTHQAYRLQLLTHLERKKQSDPSVQTDLTRQQYLALATDSVR